MIRHCLLVITTFATLAAPIAVGSPPAHATQPPVMFTAGTSPTWQTNGVAWTVASANGLVFVGGTFSSIRPPGAAPGTGEVARDNFAVFDADTGEPTSCAPTFDLPSQPAAATVRALNVSPDGQTLYVGGLFGLVNGVAQQQLAAIDIASCSMLATFKPVPNATVRAIRSTAATVYFGGDFTLVNSQARRYTAAAAAVGTATPGALLPWSPTFDKTVRALALKPDDSLVVVGGDFNTVNTLASHALAVVDGSVGTTVQTYADNFIPPTSVVKDLAVDDTGFYTANEGAGSGVFDGRIALDWSTLTQRWRDTCLGATQALVVYQGLLYSGSHAHDCTSMGWWPDGARHHFLAETTNNATIEPWFPQTDDGIGEKIGPRDMVVATAGGSDYLWAVGEFTQVNGVAQQGITRFGQGVDTTVPTSATPSIQSLRPGEVRAAWRQSFDADDSSLTYQVFRDNGPSPIYTTTARSWFWSLQQLEYTDTGLVPGSKHTYRIAVSDGTNTKTTGWVAVTVATGVSPYAERVLSDAANVYLRYDEPADTFMSDSSDGNTNLTIRCCASYKVVPAALLNDASRALTLSGAVNSYLFEERRQASPSTFSLETWFKTTTTLGGKLIGFGDKQLLPSVNADKHIYMANSGKLLFGVHNGSAFTVLQSPLSYNDGRWHQVVGAQGPQGMALFVDGALVASNSVTTNQNFLGYWRVGGDQISASWPSAPSSLYFAGSVDETAIYPTALSAATVAAHYALAVTGVGDTTPPTAPSNLSAIAAGSTVSLSWTAAGDDVGVTGYDIYRSATSGFVPDSASFVGTTSTRTYTEGLVPAGTWFYTVVARDAAGNRSSPAAQAAVSIAAEQVTVKVSPTADTYANQGAAATNYGASSSLVSRGTPGYVSYLRFVIPAPPAGRSLVSAALQIRTSTDPTAGSLESHTITLASDAWTESTLTWNNRPRLAGPLLGTIRANTTPSAVYSSVLDVPTVAGLLGTQATVSVNNTGTDSLWFWSSNQPNTSFRPQLILTFA